jgi:uncharacterized protein
VAEVDHDGDELPPPPAHALVTGWRRGLYVALGFGFLGVAYIGVITPGFPTVVWLLLASYFFARSHPRMRAWLWRSPLFGPLLRDWELHGGMRPKSKIISVTMMITACTLSILFANVPMWVRYAIGGAGCVGLCVVLFVVKTVRVSARTLPPESGSHPESPSDCETQ